MFFRDSRSLLSNRRTFKSIGFLYVFSTFHFFHFFQICYKIYQKNMRKCSPQKNTQNYARGKPGTLKIHKKPTRENLESPKIPEKSMFLTDPFFHHFFDAFFHEFWDPRGTPGSSQNRNFRLFFRVFCGIVVLALILGVPWAILGRFWVDFGSILSSISVCFRFGFLRIS